MEPLLHQMDGHMQRLLYLARRVEHLQHPVHKLRVTCILNVEAPFVVAPLPIEGICKTNGAGDYRAIGSINESWHPVAVGLRTTFDRKVDQITIPTKTRAQQWAHSRQGTTVFQHQVGG